MRFSSRGLTILHYRVTQLRNFLIPLRELVDVSDGSDLTWHILMPQRDVLRCAVM